MKDQITNYIRAGYSGLFLTTYEEQRAEIEMQRITKKIGFELNYWSITEGIVSVESGEVIPDTNDPLSMLDRVLSLPEKSVVVLRDFHLFVCESNPIMTRKLKDTLWKCKASSRVLVGVGCQLRLAPEIEKEFAVIEFTLPTREQLMEVLEGIAKSADIHLNGNTDKILDSASGMTTTEAENAFALSVVECKDIDPDIVAREKATTVKKNGLLEIVETETKLSDIGGLENLKEDLHSKRNLFGKAAREYGLPTPRGMLVVGQPGTGKSLTATATRSVFNIPLVRLEAGKLFGSLVGESERNWRTAFATVKAISPCVLWVDEVDGLFAGGESSGRTDGGTTQRVLKAILQDMQMNSDGIFFVFTANDVDNLPDPLIDRLDVWSVDLPTQVEREAIWEIVIEKRKRSPKKFPLKTLAEATDGFSGRQIEQVWLKAMTNAFNNDREPVASDATNAAAQFTPTSVLMADAIERRRKRLANRAMPASRCEAPQKAATRKLTVK